MRAKQRAFQRWKSSPNRQWMEIGSTLGQNQLDEAFRLGLNEGYSACHRAVREAKKGKR